jgi:hypothetical protein
VKTPSAVFSEFKEIFEIWIENNLKGSGRGIIEVLSQHFPVAGLRKTTESRVRITGVPA